MDNYNDDYSDSKKSSGDEDFFNRYSFDEEPEEKTRWWIPLTIALILIAGIGTFWFLNSRSPFGWFQSIRERLDLVEQEVQVTLPEDLFAGQDIEAVTARALEEKGVDEIVTSEDGSLIYMMSPAVRDNLLQEAANDLEDQLATFEDGNQYPYIVEISHDDSFETFSLVVDLEEDELDAALSAASELFVASVYYQHFKVGQDAVPGVVVTIEDSEAATLDKLAYPGDLNRAAAVLERPEMTFERPRLPAAGDRVIVTTGPDNLNLRNGPEITYLIIDVLSSGTVLEVIGVEGVWLEVITPDQKEGWVHGDFVEFYDEED